MKPGPGSGQDPIEQQRGRNLISTELTSPVQPGTGRPKIVVVGLNFGRGMVREILSPKASPYVELAGVCDLDRAKAAEVGAEHGLPVYASLDEVLADPEIAAIGLFTGPVGRAALMDRMIEAGKHVMTTKPLEADPEAALAVLRKARRLGRAIHLNSPSALPGEDMVQVEAWREELGLGRIVAARAETWVSYREEADGGWYDDPEKCPVAPIFRLGIYLINDLLRLFGPARRVQVLSSRLFTGRPTPDNAQLGIEFENGGLANVFASFCVGDGDFYRTSLALNFENGTVYRNVGPGRTALEHGTCQLTCVQPRDGRGVIVAETVLPSMSGAYDWATFARAVRGDTLSGEATPEDVAAGIRVIAAMARAERTGSTAEVEN